MNDARRLFLTGGTGFVGRKLAVAALTRGWAITALTRDIRRAHQALAGAPGAIDWIEGDPGQEGRWCGRLAECQAVVALAGEPIFKDRWNDAVKARLMRSRAGAAGIMTAALAALAETARPEVLVTASSYGWYPERGAAVMDETEAAPGDDFLGRLSADWEESAAQAAAHGVRVVCLRFGLVLGDDGGLLEGLLPRFRAFVGGPVGSGRQYLPMVHADDAVALAMMAIERRDAAGPLNVVMPITPTMNQFAQALGRTLHRPAALRLPTFLARLKLGEAAAAVVGSRHVVPARAEALRYQFRFPEIGRALDDLIGRSADTGK